MEIDGKKAMLVGGASGFGRATAELLRAKGASVAILDRPNTEGRDVEYLHRHFDGDSWESQRARLAVVAQELVRSRPGDPQDIQTGTNLP